MNANRFPNPFIPQAVFSVEEGPQRCVPRVLAAPSRYIQGDRTLDHLGDIFQWCQATMLHC